MTRKISIIVIIAIAFFALLQCNVFAAETLPEAVDGVITLTEDVILTKPAVIDGTVTLNLNGKTIKNTTNIWVDTDEINDWSLISVRGGNLTINGNGTLAAKDGDCYAVDVQKGTLTINGGTYIGNISAVYVLEGLATINGGTYSVQQTDPKGGQNGYGYTLNCLDANYKNKSANIKVTGGTYSNYDPSDAAEIADPKNYVVAGYKSVAEGENYKVVDAHTKLTKTDAKAATYTANGNIEYYTCGICGKLFEDKEATKETNSIKVVIPMLIQVNNSGNASVDNVVVDDAITESGNSSVVELPAIENATSVTVPVESVKAVENADKGLTVATKDTTVTLDAKAVEEVAKQAGTATKITIEVTKTEEKTLNKEQKEAIKDKEVAIVLSAKILADGNEISNFNGGKVKVEIPFTPAEGTKGSDYKVYYVADDGKVEAIPTRYVKEKLVVELEHFSEYVVVKEVATAAPAPSAPAASANPNEKDNTPKTGAVSVIGLVVAMSVIGLAVLRKRD